MCAFIERNLVHGPGDWFGKPFVLRPWEQAIVYRMYELTPAGTRCWRSVLLGLPKGNAKTELGAAVAIAEAAGPVIFDGWKPDGRPKGKARISPDIPMAAASFEQADLVFGAARAMIREGPLADLFEVYDTEILLKNRPGRLYRVAAVAGTNDGGRPSFAVRDEVHEWTGTKERVHLVIENNLAKRAGTWGLDISTAHWDLGALLGRLYQRGQRIAAGEEPANGFLMIWYQAPEGLNLADPAEFADACKQANPALGDFLQLENLQARYRDLPEHEFRRYHLNQWTSSPTRWMPAGIWEARAAPETAPPPEGAPIVLGLDGDWSGLSTGLMGCTLSRPRHLFTFELWEKPEQQEKSAAEWTPPKLEDVKERIRAACATWRVQAIAANAFRWPELFNDLLAEGLPMVEWPTHVTARIAPACRQLYDAVAVNQDVTHDGSEGLSRHVKDAHVEEDAHDRLWITKAPLAVASVIAYDMAVRTPEEGDAGVDFV